MIILRTSIEAEGWPDEDYLESMAQAAINAAIDGAGLSLPEGAEVSVVFSDEAQIQALNREWRGMDKPTNVLSFAANDGLSPSAWSPLLGDIVLARETIAREAAEQAKTFNDHLMHLIVHGFLHLTGFDHIDDNEAETMEAIERHVLARLGIADPYADA